MIPTEAIRASAVALQRGDPQGALDTLAPWLHADVAVVHANASVALSRLGDRERALAHARRAWDLDDVLPVGPYQVGQLQSGVDDGAAAAAYREALRRQPSFALAEGALGACLMRLGDLDAAAACYRRALDLDGALTHVAHNLAQVEIARSRPDLAAPWFERALAVREDPVTRMDLGMAQLQCGRWDEGWRNYAARWQVGRPAAAPTVAAPLWDGGPLHGRRLGLCAEQGLGDGIQFARYASVLADRGATVVAIGHPSQTRWFRAVPGVSEAATLAEPPAVDVQLPMLAAPPLLGLPRPEQGPSPYVDVPPDPDVPVDGLAIGVHWSAGPVLRATKGVPLRALAALADPAGVNLYSLQFGPEAADIAACGFPIRDLSPWLGDFWQTARVVRRMALVVTSDSALAHVAASVGVPTLVLLPTPCDWRWGTAGVATPWYPAMELHRQPTRGDWAGAAAAVVARVRDLVGRGMLGA